MLFVGLFVISYLSAHTTMVEGLSYSIEDADFETLDPEYADTAASNAMPVWTSDDKSGIAVNLTIIKDLPKGLMGHLNIYLKTMGEYKTHSGITATLPWCKMILDPVMLSSLMTAMGMAKDCPPKAGHYGTDFWAPSTALMPDHLPGMDYKVVFGILYKKKILLSLSVFATVS